MVEHSDYLIAYVRHSGNAQDLVEYAQKREKQEKLVWVISATVLPVLWPITTYLYIEFEVPACCSLIIRMTVLHPHQPVLTARSIRRGWKLSPNVPPLSFDRFQSLLMSLLAKTFIVKL